MMFFIYKRDAQKKAKNKQDNVGAFAEFHWVESTYYDKSNFTSEIKHQIFMQNFKIDS
jgi:hypothetical protein